MSPLLKTQNKGIKIEQIEGNVVKGFLEIDKIHILVNTFEKVVQKNRIYFVVDTSQNTYEVSSGDYEIAKYIGTQLNKIGYQELNLIFNNDEKGK